MKKYSETSSKLLNTSASVTAGSHRLISTQSTLPDRNGKASSTQLRNERPLCRCPLHQLLCQDVIAGRAEAKRCDWILLLILDSFDQLEWMDWFRDQIKFESAVPGIKEYL